MEEDEEFFRMEKEDTYFGTWDGMRGWNTYTGDRNERRKKENENNRIR